MSSRRPIRDRRRTPRPRDIRVCGRGAPRGQWLARVTLARAVALMVVVGSLLLTAVQGEAQESGQLSVRATAEHSSSGVLRVRIARDGDEYAGESEAYLEDAVPMRGTSRTVTFDNVEPGEYAVAVYLDEDENGELNTNLFGVPKEPIGFSRNPRIGMSRPNFSETVFDYPGGQFTVDVRLKD